MKELLFSFEIPWQNARNDAHARELTNDLFANHPVCPEIDVRIGSIGRRESKQVSVHLYSDENHKEEIVKLVVELTDTLLNDHSAGVVKLVLFHNDIFDGYFYFKLPQNQVEVIQDGAPYDFHLKFVNLIRIR